MKKGEKENALKINDAIPLEKLSIEEKNLIFLQKAILSCDRKLLQKITPSKDYPLPFLLAQFYLSLLLFENNEKLYKKDLLDDRNSW